MAPDFYLLSALQVQLALQRLDWSEPGLLGTYRGARPKSQSGYTDSLEKLESLASPFDSLSSGSVLGGQSSMSPDAAEGAKGWKKGKKLRTSSKLMNSFCKCSWASTLSGFQGWSIDQE